MNLEETLETTQTLRRERGETNEQPRAESSKVNPEPRRQIENVQAVIRPHELVNNIWVSQDHRDHQVIHVQFDNIIETFEDQPGQRLELDTTAREVRSWIERRFDYTIFGVHRLMR